MMVVHCAGLTIFLVLLTLVPSIHAKEWTQSTVWRFKEKSTLQWTMCHQTVRDFKFVFQPISSATEEDVRAVEPMTEEIFTSFSEKTRRELFHGYNVFANYPVLYGISLGGSSSAGGGGCQHGHQHNHRRLKSMSGAYQFGPLHGENCSCDVFQGFDFGDNFNYDPYPGLVPNKKKTAAECEQENNQELEPVSSAPPTPVVEECSGHGHLKDNVCECDEGYTVDPENEANCVPEPVSDAPLTRVMEECSGHGHLKENNVCECDEGYTVDPENEANCVLEPVSGALSTTTTTEVECSGHGHLDGDDCHCDIDYMLPPHSMTECVKVVRANDPDCELVLFKLEVLEAGNYALFTSEKLGKIRSDIQDASGQTMAFVSCIDGCDTYVPRWGLTILACCIVCLTALVGVGATLFNQERILSAMNLLTSFAAGALLSTVLFHVYPEAAEFLEGRESWELGLCVTIGIVFGLMMEQGMHIVLHRHGVDHHHHHPRCSGDDVCSGGEDHAAAAAALEEEGIKSMRYNAHGSPVPTSAIAYTEQPPRVQHIEPVAYVVALGDFAHAFTDGILIAIGFCTCNVATGWIITMSVCLHEVPHRLGDFFIFLKAGMTIRQALVLNLGASLSSVFGGIILLASGEIQESTLGILLALGSGIMLFISLSELLPDLMHEMDVRKAGLNFLMFVIGLVVIGVTMLSHEHCHA